MRKLRHWFHSASCSGAFAMLVACMLVACMLFGGMLASCAHAPSTPAPAFVEREVVVDGRHFRYQVFVPSRPVQAGRSDATPILLFLHGSGERGNDNAKQVTVGLGPYIRARMADFPAIAVFPQAPEGSEWMGASADMALAALDAATREFGGDPQRTYLSGLSMGGYGTWELALMQPQRFAALVPICGAILPPNDERDLYVSALANLPDPYAALATRLRHVPIWIFHGAKDDLVLPDDDRKIIAAMRVADADARYTEFPDANHNAWDPAYALPELWQWLFAQHR